MKRLGEKNFYFILLIKFYFCLSNFLGMGNIEKIVFFVRISEILFFLILLLDILSCIEFVKKLGFGFYIRFLYVEWF